MRRRILVVSLLTVLLGTLLAAAQEPISSRIPSQLLNGRASYGELPLAFESNRGQANPQVKFLARGNGYTAVLTAGGMILCLRAGESAAAEKQFNASPNSNARQFADIVLKFQLLGAAQNPAVIGEGLRTGKVNYFFGSNPAKWRTNVPTYDQVRYKNVYPGIDLIYYGDHRQLEYDFAVAPGADPNRIQFEISGAAQIELDVVGNLVLHVGSRELHFQNPVIYQEFNGLRVPVSGAYALKDATHIGFQVSQYDPSKPLVIDPVLVYSSYLGGTGNDQPSGIAVDSAGSVYLAGSTDSADFPLATLGLLPAGSHVFVAKLDPTGSNLVYTDYIGGNSQEYGYALTLDSTNEAYVTGSTSSSDFPLVNPYQGVYPGSFNGFLSKISADGSSLVYSTYLGGNGSDIPAGIAIDSLSSVLIAGSTSSTNFPVANAYQATVSPNQGGLYGTYGFLTRFSPDGSSLLYSTYLAGNTNVPYNCGGTPCWDYPFSGINGISIDNSGDAYVAGNTNTYNFPTTNAYLTTNSTTRNQIVGFVSKFSSSGNLDYSTYFYEASGVLSDITAIAVDSSGSAYITGSTFSDGTFPITSTSICDPGTNGFACDFAFVTKFDSTASNLLYSTFLGPNNNANPRAITLDANNDAFVLASSTSNLFGVVNGLEPYSNGTDLILVKIDPSASTQLFATYLGGGGDDFPAGIAADPNGNLYIAGYTGSADFPVTLGAFQDMPAGNTDGFVLKIGPDSAPSVSASPDFLQYSSQAIGSTSQPHTVLLRNVGSSTLAVSSIKASGDFSESDNCGSSVPPAGSCTLSVIFAPTTVGARSGSVLIRDDATGSPHSISLSGIGTGPGSGAALNPTSLVFSSRAVGTTSAVQSVILTSTGTGPLNVANIQVTGDYAQTNNCPAQLQSSFSCTINVTFSPKTFGARKGTLTVSDNAIGSQETVDLTGTGLDFTLAGSPSSNTIKAGATATYTLSISSLGGSFPNAISLSCSGLPAQATCTFSPKTVAPGVSGGSSNLTITTAALSAHATPVLPSTKSPVAAFWIQLQGLGFVGMILTGPGKRSKRPIFLVLALLVLSTLFMSGCAGGTGTSSQIPPGATIYTVNVTGTYGNLQHVLALNLTVK